MAASGKTPILLYGSTTATNAPVAGNLTNSSDGCEIAINVADKNLFFKDSTNTVNTVPIRQSSASSNGWLSSTDWSTFNSKQPAGSYLTSVTVDAPLTGAGTSGSHLSIPAASGSTNGYLSSTDWTTFNSKVSSQWTTSGSNIYYTTGNVGVGTSTPGARLGVSGNQINYGTNPYIALSNVYNDTPSYVQYLTTDNALSFVCAGGANTGYIKFATGNGNERVRVFASGGVSVGNITDPGATNLSVTGTITSAAHTASGFIPNSSTIPSDGMYLPATNLVGFSSGSTYRGGWLGAALLLGTSGTGTTFSNATSNGVDLYQLGFHYYRNTGTTAGRYYWLGVDSGSSFIVYNNASTGVYLAYGATSWAGNSDERVKTDLTPIENGLSKVCSLRSVTGRYTKDEPGTSRSFLIAQDVQKVLPEAVNVQDDEQGTLGLQYTDVIPLLVAAIKELKQEFDEYKATHP